MLSKNRRVSAVRPATAGGRTSHAPAAVLASLVVGATSLANGIYRNGAGASAMSLGGAGVARPDGPVSSLHANPAGLSLATRPTLQLGGFGALASGDHDNATGSGDLDGGLGALAEGAFVLPLKSLPVTLGLGFIPDAVLDAGWQFTDAPSTGGVSYGPQEHRSRILVLRTALGASVEIEDRLHLGAAFGLIYNRNELHAPYIFQATPGLAGAKTLLDLETDGWGYNGIFGVLYRATDALHLGISYQTATKIDADGSASGDAGVQLGQPSFPFTYAAEVANELPQMVSGGGSWQATPWLRALVQVDWINWADAFDELPITLGNGSNPGLPPTLQDTIPLAWRDRWVFRTGLEFTATDALLFRAGYAYGDNPVPAGTLTPMTAAILEHTVTAGLEWRQPRWSVALAYQYDFTNAETVGVSRLGAEYNNTRTEVGVHWLGLTTTWWF